MSYWQNKRVMITGGEGFLGSHVVQKLRLAGCTQNVVVRHRDFDLSQEEDVRRLFEEHHVDVLLHLAGLVGGIAANKAKPADFFFQNLMMNTLTLHHAWQAGVKKVVTSGAGCGYPEHAPLPLRETSFWDGFPQMESAPYSLAKRMLHVQSMAYWTQHPFGQRSGRETHPNLSREVAELRALAAPNITTPACRAYSSSGSERRSRPASPCWRRAGQPGADPWCSPRVTANKRSRPTSSFRT